MRKTIYILGIYLVTDLVRECQILTRHLAKRGWIVWIPGYVGMRGNEIPDELSRKGAERIPVGPELAPGPIGHRGHTTTC